MKKTKTSLAQARSVKVKWFDDKHIELTICNLVNGESMAMIIPIDKTNFSLKDIEVIENSGDDNNINLSEKGE